MASSDNEEHELNENGHTEEEEDELHEAEDAAVEEAEEAEEEEEDAEEEVEKEENNEENENENDEEEKNNEKDENDESDEEFAGFGDDEINANNKKIKNRQIVTDEEETAEANDDQEEDDDDSEKINPKKHKSKRVTINDSDNDQEEEQEHQKEDQEDDQDDDQEEESAGNEEESEITAGQKRLHSDSEGEKESSQHDSEEAPAKKKRPEKESDLEKMLKKNQAEKRRKNRRKNADSEELNEMDNKISMIIAEMKNVAAEDRAANEKSLTTLQKIKMLPNVINMLQKSEYHATMIELGVLGAIAEWLAPLPDRSLPNISIRDQLIDALRDFGEINVDYLKSSGVGKAVMFLYKHSKETKSNKQKLEKLINNWARPIFNLDSNFKQLTKEERLERDMEHIKSLNKRSSNEFNQGQSVDELLDSSYSKRKKTKNDNSKASADSESKKVLRPGDPGFIPRARVPIPSSKDYIIRPKSNIEAIEGMSEKKVKKTESRLDKHKKRFIEIKKNAKSSRAVTMVAAGGK